MHAGRTVPGERDLPEAGLKIRRFLDELFFAFFHMD